MTDTVGMVRASLAGLVDRQLIQSRSQVVFPNFEHFSCDSQVIFVQPSGDICLVVNKSTHYMSRTEREKKSQKQFG